MSGCGAAEWEIALSVNGHAFGEDTLHAWVAEWSEVQ